MGEILDFGKSKDERTSILVDEVITDISMKAGNCGLEETVNLESFVPQGVIPVSGFENSPYVENLNKYSFRVNNRFVQKGWIIAGTVRLDEDYFSRRAEFLEGVKWRNIREERSHHFESGDPVMVFYGKH